MLELWEPEGQRTWLASFAVRSAFRPWYDEIDSYGHVSNIEFPRYFELGRMQYFKRVGDPEPTDGAFPFPHVIAEQHVRYIGRLFYDEPLEVLTKIVELGTSSAGFEQAIAGEDGAVRAIARTVIVHTHKLQSCAWTSAQREAIATFEGFQTSSVRES